METLIRRAASASWYLNTEEIVSKLIDEDVPCDVAELAAVAGALLSEYIQRDVEPK